MYVYRKLTAEQRVDAMRHRIQRGGSWHRPPVWDDTTARRYLITAACYDHAPLIGYTPSRLMAFEDQLIAALQTTTDMLHAHVVLPNHYHALITSRCIRTVRLALGRLHGRMARCWNQQESTPRRQVFHGCAETVLKSEAHFFATLNYIHHNPVRHGYVQCWQDWPWSSAADYLAAVGHAEAARTWRHYPIGRYGESWD
jgi:putative transposase